MELWRAALEEVALSGLEGCTLEELWHHLSTRDPPQPALDEASRAFLWRSFLRPGQKEVQFFELPEDRLPLPLEEEEEGLSSPLPHRYIPVCDRESGVMGSCTTYSTRQDSTAHLKETTPSLQEVEERYSRRLVLVGSQALRESVLLLHKTLDPVFTMETLWYCVLELVASFRGRGVLRSSVSQGYIGSGDSRKTWHIVKRFKQMGLLVCKEVTTKKQSRKHKGLNSSEHRVYHVKFAPLIGLESHDLQPIRLEEGEGADESTLESTESARTPVIGELPVDYQIYQMVDSAGARGVSTVEFRQQGLRLPLNWQSGFIKAVPSMPQYVLTTMDGSVTKTYRIIAKKHAHQNTDIQSLLRLSERKFPLVKKEEPVLVNALAVETEEGDVSMATEGGEASTLVGEDREAVSLIDSKALLNIRQQKRKQMVLDFFSERPALIMDNPQLLRIYIAEQEKSEGSSRLIDKRTVSRLLSDMVNSGHLKTVTLNLQGTEGAEESRKEVQMYCLADTPDGIVERHVETVKEFYASHKLKAEQRMAAKVGETGSSISSEGESGTEEEEEGEEEVEESDTGDSPGEQPGRMLTSKFQKLRHLHIYLWLLSNGCSEEEWCQLSSILPPVQYPWVGHMVGPATPPSSGRVSITYKEVLDQLPLCAILMLFGVQKYARRPPSVKNYFKNPEHHGIRFCRLPVKIKNVLSHSTSSVSLLSYKMATMLTQLRDMRLVDMSVDCLTSRNKDLATISLNAEASFLDTTNCAPRRSFFLESVRSSFPTVTLPLRSLSNLLHYWFQLNQICTSTPILIKGAHKGEATDEHALPWTSGKKSIAEQAEYDSQGFGAGGFPPSFFAHLARNWNTFLKPVASSGGGARASLHHCEDDVNGESPTVTGNTPSGTPLGTVLHGGDCIQVIEVPKGVISRGKGGRGFKRPPRQLDEGENPEKKSKKSSTLEGGETCAYTQRRKFKWSAEEDNLLLMARVALRVLQRLRCPELQGMEMVQSLHEDFGLSESKDLASVKRRLQTLARNKSFQMSVGALAEEFLQDTKQQGEGGDEEDITFSHVLSVLKTRHGVVSSSAQGPSSVLPHTVQEFYAMYNVLDPQEDLKDTPPVPSTDNMADLNRSLLMDIIYCVLLSDLPYQEMYLAYKVLEAFPESDLQAIFRLLRDRFLLKQKRTYNVGVLTRQGIHETGRYLISSSVQNTLFGNIPPQFRAEMSAVLSRLAQQAAPQHSRDVPVSDEGAGPSRELESQLEVAPPEEECLHRISMDNSEMDAAHLSVLLNAVAGMVGGGAGGGTHEAPVEKVEMTFPSHFFNGYEKLVHPIATGNSTEDMMESDGESEGESEGGGVMKEAERTSGPLLAGQLQFYVPEHTKINYVDIMLSPGCSIGRLLQPTEEEGQDQFMEHDKGAMPGDGPVTEGEGLSGGPVTKGVTPGDGPVTEGVTPGDCPVTEGVTPGDGPVTEGVTPEDCPVTEGVTPGDGPVTEGVMPGDGPVTEGAMPGDGLVTEGVTPGDGPITEDLLCSICSDLGMSEQSTVTALSILKAVRDAGPIGRPMTAIKKDVLLLRGMPQDPLDDIVQVLLNLGMLHAVGTTDQRLVAAEHSAPWHTASRILAASSTKSPFPCQSQFRIWSSLSGTGHINEQALRAVKDAVCLEVNRRPGVTLLSLKEHFCGSLQPAALVDLLQLLVAEDCVTVHRTVQQMDTSNFFSKPAVQISSTEDEFDDLSYFEPTLNNDIFLATLK